MKKIGIIGAGHVGLVTGACFAKIGHTVVCADTDVEKIKNLERLVMPFFEPGMEEIVREAVKSGRLSFTTSLAGMTEQCEVIFIAVGTPPTPQGRADLTYVEQVTVEIAKALVEINDRRKPGGGTLYRLIVEKSTVPVLTGEWVKRTLALLTPTGVEFDIAANPEFLREGSAVKDFMEPDRIIVGVENKRSEELFREIYAPIKASLVFTDIKSAELIKHASNSYLALKISYINAVSQICERVGADIEKVSEGMGFDTRIGRQFLKAGIGYGGSCFPKDVAAFIALADEVGYSFDLLKDVERINREQRSLVVKKARELLWNLKGKEIAVLGMAFKPDTDDVRESPAVDIVTALREEGAVLKCHDPKAAGNARKILPDLVFVDDPYEAVRDTHLVILLTEWREYRDLDFARVRRLMTTPYLIDGRNCLDPAVMQQHGFVYVGIGRGGRRDA